MRLSCNFVLLLAFTASAQFSKPASVLSKSIDIYLNFPGRVVDFVLGNNSKHWCNSTVDISAHTRTVYQCW